VEWGNPEIFQLLLERRGDAGPSTDTSMAPVKTTINDLTAGHWVYMRILQLFSPAAEVDANNFTDSGPYDNPSAARRDRDELFSDVLSGSTTRDKFVCNLVSVAVDEVGPIAVAEILSTTRHDSVHEDLEEKHSGSGSPSASATAIGEIVP